MNTAMNMVWIQKILHRHRHDVALFTAATLGLTAIFANLSSDCSEHMQFLRDQEISSALTLVQLGQARSTALSLSTSTVYTLEFSGPTYSITVKSKAAAFMNANAAMQIEQENQIQALQEQVSQTGCSNYALGEKLFLYASILISVLSASLQ